MSENTIKRISECIAPRGSFTSDDQEYSSYPFVFDRNCPYGVTDKEIIDRDNIKVCQPHLPPFQNQYTIHSHFQDLYLKPDCPSCITDPNPNVCNKTSNLNNNPQCLKSDCLIVDPGATQFATIPMPVCFDSNTSYMLPNGKNGYSTGEMESIKDKNFPNLSRSSLMKNLNLQNRNDSPQSLLSSITMIIFWIIGIYLVLYLINSKKR